DLAADLNYRAGEFMAEDHRRVTAESAVHDVQVRAAHAAEGDFDLDLARTANRLIHIEDLEIAFPGGELDERLHALSTLTKRSRSIASTPGRRLSIRGIEGDLRCTTMARAGLFRMARRSESRGAAILGKTVLAALHSTMHSLPWPSGKRKSTSRPC